MKAAVIYREGAAPQYAEVPDPIPATGEVLVRMKAVAVTNNERSVAEGTHYSSTPFAKPKIPGRMGVGMLKDGKRVAGIYLGGGLLAEKALMNPAWTVKLPDGIDDVTAAALPNAVIGSAMALLHRAKFKAGEVVLINGATGFTGTLAVQLAKLYGASKMIATGRNEAQLQKLLTLGADEIISLQGSDEAVTSQLNATFQQTSAHVVLDYLWGHPAGLLLEACSGNGRFTHPLRYIAIGATAGDKIELSAEMLRSVDITVMGSGQGSLPKEAIGDLFSQVLPQVFEWTAAGKLRIETVTMELKDIEAAFFQKVASAQRLVITI